MNAIEIKKLNSKDSNYLTLKPCWLDSSDVIVKVLLEHDSENLFLTFDVIEKQLIRMSTHHNDEVYEDSCVEIFIKREDEEFYRNFELSATTFMLVGKGTSRHDRIRYDETRIEKIERSIQILENNYNRSHYIINEKINLKDWHLLKEGEDIKDLKLMGNIYKCGYTFEKPHYQSLFEMNPDIIDFHKPEYFRCFKLI